MTSFLVYVDLRLALFHSKRFLEIRGCLRTRYILLHATRLYILYCILSPLTRILLKQAEERLRKSFLSSTSPCKGRKSQTIQTCPCWIHELCWFPSMLLRASRSRIQANRPSTVHQKPFQAYPSRESSTNDKKLIRLKPPLALN